MYIIIYLIYSYSWLLWVLGSLHCLHKEFHAHVLEAFVAKFVTFCFNMCKLTLYQSPKTRDFTSTEIMLFALCYSDHDCRCIANWTVISFWVWLGLTGFPLVLLIGLSECSQLLGDMQNTNLIALETSADKSRWNGLGVREMWQMLKLHDVRVLTLVWFEFHMFLWNKNQRLLRWDILRNNVTNRPVLKQNVEVSTLFDFSNRGMETSTTACCFKVLNFASPPQHYEHNHTWW